MWNAKRDYAEENQFKLVMEDSDIPTAARIKN